MQVFFAIAYFAMGLVQLVAIMDGAKVALGVGSFFSFIIGCFLTYIPLIGSAFGVYGAHTVWGWSMWAALAMFFWYVPLFLLSVVFSAFSRR